MNELEIWKPIHNIEGFEGLYEISSFGNVRSLGRIVYDSIGRKRYIKPKPLNYSIPKQKRKYAEVRLTNLDGKSKSFNIHSLVAKTFIPNPLNKPVVNHIDGNKSNNRVDNLEWVTYSENNQHAYSTNLRSDNRKVLCIDKTTKQIICVYNSTHEAARQHDCNYATIWSRCKKDSNKPYKGYLWKFLNKLEDKINE